MIELSNGDTLKTLMDNPKGVKAQPIKTQTRQNWLNRPTPLSSDYYQLADFTQNEVRNIYASAPKGKQLSGEDRFVSDVLMSRLFNVPYQKVADNHGYYSTALFGKQIDDKSIWQAFSDSFMSSFTQRNIANLQNRLDKLSDDDQEAEYLRKRIESEENKLFNQQTDASTRNFFTNSFVGAGNLIGQQLPQMGITLLATVATMGMAGAGFGVSAFSNAMRSTAVRATSTGYAFLSSYNLERGLASNELSKVRDEYGNPLDPDIRKRTATIVGLINGAIEVLPSDGISRYMWGLNESDLIEKYVKSRLGKFVVENLIEASSESGEEFFQTIVSDIGEYIAKELNDKAGKSQFDEHFIDAFSNAIMDGVKSFGDAFGPSLLTGAVGSGFTNGMNFLNNKADKEVFKANKSFVEENLDKFNVNTKENASKLQNVGKDTNVASADLFDVKTTKATQDYGKTAEGESVKIDPVKVFVRPNDESLLTPINKEEADKLKWLVENGADDIAYTIIKEDLVELSKDALENLGKISNGELSGDDIIFNSVEERDNFVNLLESQQIFVDNNVLKYRDSETRKEVSLNLYTQDEKDTTRLSREGRVISTKIQEATGGLIYGREANLLGELLATTLKGKSKNITADRISILNEEKSGYNLNGAKGATIKKSLSIILSDKADATTINHEGFHVVLEIDEDSRKALQKAVRETFLNNDEVQELKTFIEENSDVFPEGLTVEKLLSVLSSISEESGLTDDQNEALTYLHSAWQKNTDAKNIPTGIREIFKKVQDLVREVYQKVTGRKLNDRLDNAFSNFYGNYGIIQEGDSNGLQGHQTTIREGLSDGRGDNSSEYLQRKSGFTGVRDVPSVSEGIWVSQREDSRIRGQHDRAIRLNNDLQKVNPNAHFVEIPQLKQTKENAELFRNALEKARNTQKYGLYVSLYDLETSEDGIGYNDPRIRLFLSKDLSTGFAIKDDGDIVSVFADKTVASHPLSVYSILLQALENGGTKLDCYGDKLLGFYETMGFKLQGKVAYNEEYESAEWTAKKDILKSPDVFALYWADHSIDETVARFEERYEKIWGVNGNAYRKNEIANAREYIDSEVNKETIYGYDQLMEDRDKSIQRRKEKEALIARYTDKNSGEMVQSEISDRIYVAKDRLKVAKAQRGEGKKFDFELQQAKILTDYYKDSEIYLLPESVGKEYEVILHGKNPDGVFFNKFIELKSNNGKKRAIQDSLRDAKEQNAEIVYINVYKNESNVNKKTFKDAIKGQIKDNPAYEGMKIIASIEGKNFNVFDIKNGIVMEDQYPGQSEVYGPRSNNKIQSNSESVKLNPNDSKLLYQRLTDYDISSKYPHFLNKEDAYKKTAEAVPEAHALMDDIVKLLNISKERVSIRPVLKGEARAIQKVKENGGSWSSIRDINGAMINMPNYNSMEEAYLKLKEIYKDSIFESKEKQTEAGYYDRTIFFKMSNGSSFELQILTEPILNIKNGVGHKIYEVIRETEPIVYDIKATDDTELYEKFNSVLKALNEWSTDIYSHADEIANGTYHMLGSESKRLAVSELITLLSQNLELKNFPNGSPYGISLDTSSPLSSNSNVKYLAPSFLKNGISSISKKVSSILNSPEYNNMVDNNNLQLNPNDSELLYQQAVENDGEIVKLKPWTKYEINEIERLVVSNAFVPTKILNYYLERHPESNVLRVEAHDRKVIANLYKAGINFDFKTLDGFIDSIKGKIGEENWNDNLNRVFTKAYLYKNVKSPVQMEKDFIKRRSSLKSLLALKKLYSLKRLTGQKRNGDVYSYLFIPKNSYVYQTLQTLNENSSEEEVQRVLDKIKKNPRPFVKAEIQIKKDYQQANAFMTGSEKYLDTIAKLQFLNIDSAEVNDPIVLNNDKKVTATLEEELAELSRAKDETNVLSEEIDTDEINKAISESSKGIDETFISSEKEFYENLIKETDEQTESEFKETIANKISYYEGRLQKLRDSKDNALEKQADKYRYRIGVLRDIRDRKAIIDKTKRKVKQNLALQDATVVETLRYVHHLLMNRKEIEDLERKTISTGIVHQNKENNTTVETDTPDRELLLETGLSEDELVESYFNSGLFVFDSTNVPEMLAKYLNIKTLDKLRSGSQLNDLTTEDMNNIYVATVLAKDYAKKLLEARKAPKRARRNEKLDGVLASVFSFNEGLPKEILEPLLKEEGIDINTLTDREISKYAKDKRLINKFLTTAGSYDVLDNSKMDKVNSLMAGSFGHAQNIFRMLDGWKEGALYNAFVKEPQSALDRMQTEINRRKDSAFDRLSEILGSDIRERNSKRSNETKDKLKWLNDEYDIAGFGNRVTNKLTGWNIVGAYAYSKNIHGFIKLVSQKGNNISLEEIAKINPTDTLRFIDESLERRSEKRYRNELGQYRSILYQYSTDELINLKNKIERGEIKSTLPQFALDIADMMIDELGKETKRLNKVAYDLYNHPFTEQENYFPLVRSFVNEEAEIGKQMFEGAWVNKSFIESRQLNDSYSLLLDPMGVFLKAIEAQERFANVTEVVDDLNYMLAPYGGNLNKILSDKYGFGKDSKKNGMTDFITSYMRVLAGQSETQTTFERISGKVLSNVATAKIAMNLGSVVRQLGSYLTTIMDGEVSLKDLVSSTFNLATNGKEMYELYNTLAPDLATYSFDLNIDEFKKNLTGNTLTDKGNKYLDNMLEIGMKGTEAVDKLVKVIAWYSAYNKYKDTLGEQEASQRATLLVKRTQSISDPLSQSVIQNKKNPFLKAMFMFMNDTFQMWNMVSFGLQDDIYNKNYANIARRLAIITLTIGFSAFVGGELIRDDDEKDEEGWIEFLMKTLAENGIEYIPLIGSFTANKYSGYENNLLTDAFGIVGNVLKRATDDEEITLKSVLKDTQSNIMDSLELLGIPINPLKRYTQLLIPEGIENGIDLEWGNLGYLVNKTWGNHLREKW